MAIDQFDRVTLRVLRAEIDAALTTIATRHNIKLTLGGMRFGATSFKAAVEGATLTADGSNAAAADEWRRYAGLFGMDVDAFGQPFMSRGVEYRVVAIKPRSPRFPVIGERADGKKFKFPPSVVPARPVSR